MQKITITFEVDETKESQYFSEIIINDAKFLFERNLHATNFTVKKETM